jgi:hypothetical protein
MECPPSNAGEAIVVSDREGALPEQHTGVDPKKAI